jgi:Tfp pilus assembly protein PilX
MQYIDTGTALFIGLLIVAIVGLIGMVSSYAAREEAMWRQNMSDKLDELLNK